jgi:glycosyltransferase involved in cell wall biosynthesis
VRDGVSGLLVEENDPAAFARALETLIRDPARRHALGAAAQARVRGDFAFEENLERLARRFGLAAASEAGLSARRLLRTA